MNEYDILLRVVSALVAGGLIGLERTHRGRAAGLRTYALVAMGSALLVASAQYAMGWAALGGGDPTRVIQGIVTGIGFLGAGVILKDGFAVRGLTTAASIWVVASIGIAFGAGLFMPGSVATVVTWATLGLLARVEGRIPVQSMVNCHVAFQRSASFDEARLRELVGQHGYQIIEFACQLDGVSGQLGYELVMLSMHPHGLRDLERGLLAEPAIQSFRIAPSRD